MLSIRFDLVFTSLPRQKFSKLRLIYIYDNTTVLLIINTTKGESWISVTFLLRNSVHLVQAPLSASVAKSLCKSYQLHIRLGMLALHQPVSCSCCTALHVKAVGHRNASPLTSQSALQGGTFTERTLPPAAYGNTEMCLARTSNSARWEPGGLADAMVRASTILNGCVV